MNILVTGANGFVGKNLVVELKNQGYENIMIFDIDTDKSLLDEYARKADFVFHLAGVNRPNNKEEFMTGNFVFTSELLSLLKKYQSKAPIMLASSTQAKFNNPYGKSKSAGEKLLRKYSQKMEIPIYIYRFPNLYGKWSKPNYNSVVATFCYKIVRDEEVVIHDPNSVINLTYIDDVLKELLSLLEAKGTNQGNFYEVPKVAKTTVGEIFQLLTKFKNSRKTLEIPKLDNQFEKNLYSTYLSFLPKDHFRYDLKMNEDTRGSFSEFIRTPERGQVSINISKPGIVRGNHWHHTKNEKFLVVSGTGVIRVRQVNDENKSVIEYYISGEKLEVVDIPVGYIHSIENLGDTDMVTVMWVNEVFDPNSMDTYFVEV
ncbi:MAG: NAD-dependent epimerase/dehydratase family protein [Streptococcaceae bacterium]|nr:NAD-dependent epimerase/dehydratase family protein [Streptococcaceae bacterium]